MNALKPLTLALVLALVAVPGALFAQGFFGGHGHGRGGPDGMFGHGGAGFLLGPMGDAIGLTDEQRDQIEAILEQARPAMDELREQARAARDAFQSSQQPGEFDEAAARQFAQSQAQLHSEMMVQGMRLRAQVHAVLSPEQQAKLEQMRDRRQERREQRGKRRGGGAGGGTGGGAGGGAGGNCWR